MDKNVFRKIFINVLIVIISFLIIYPSHAESMIIYQKGAGPINEPYYHTKEYVFKEFFKDFFNYIVNDRNGASHLIGYGIYSLDDFYILCSLKNKYTGLDDFSVGNVVGAYFARSDKVENLYKQTSKDGFVGWCLENHKYEDLILFLVDFFKNYRKDEGLVEKMGEKATDFLYYPHDTIIDVCKLFYYNETNLPSLFRSKGYIDKWLNNIPGVSK